MPEFRVTFDMRSDAKRYLQTQMPVSLSREEWSVVMAALQTMRIGMPQDGRAAVVLQEVCEQLGLDFTQVTKVAGKHGA